MRFQFNYFAIAVGILLLEVFVATTFSAIEFIRGSVGDILVVILIYYLLLAFRRFQPVPLAVGIFVFACAVEVAQYFRLADVLGLERGSLLSILIGTTFSWLDIVMYAVGCVLAVVLHVTVFEKESARGEITD
jgi:hypothetical protein